MPIEILELLNVPRDLTLEFLAIFARFEFALKKAGYAGCGVAGATINCD